MILSNLPQHHAILITHADRKSIATTLWNELQSSSLTHTFFDQTILDIDTSREIISWAKSPLASERTALISFHTASIPAQNALLKILEEPLPQVSFILLTSSKDSLLDTIISRVQHHQIDNEATNIDKRSDAYLFLSTSPTERMTLKNIISILSSTDEEDRKDREKVRAFVLSLIPYLSRLPNLRAHIPEVIEVASFASYPSSSGKALLEYLSLLLPQIKS